MRWTRWTAAACSMIGAIAAVIAVSCTTMTPSRTGEGDPAAKIARGRYLVGVISCGDCHTPGALYGAPDTTRLLSGTEMGWVGPWGTTYARNLTPDVETGLGAWSEDDIVKAIRTGMRPDASPVLPPMPWTSFASLTDDDAYAVAAYLKSIPVVSHKVPDRLPPSAKATGSLLVFPPPTAWDAPRTPPEGSATASPDTAAVH